MIEAHSPFQQGSGKGAVMGIGGPEQEVDGQAGAATEQGMHPIAAQKRAGMLGRGMTKGRIGVGSAPGEDGRTVDDQIACPNESAADGLEHAEHEERLRSRSPCGMAALPLLRGAGNAGAAIFAHRQATRQS